MKIKLILLGSILILSNTIRADWDWQSFKPQGNDLNAIFFISENKGWAAGDLGTILKTTNSGTNWEPVFTDSLINFKTIYFISESIGYAAGEKGIVYKTTDGGNTWELKNYDPTLSINTIYFSSENTGWIGGDRIIGLKDSTLYKTTNGGETWIKVQNISNFIPTSIRFFSDKRGWILGTYSAGNIYSTNNGGISWELKHLDDYIFDLTYAPSENFVYVIGNFGFFRSTSDGGENWEQKQIKYSGHDVHLKSAFFISDSVGWIAGTRDDGTSMSACLILKTMDGGKNFQVIDTSIRFTPNCIQFISQQTGWAVSDYGLIVKTTDGGHTWIEQSETSQDSFYTFHKVDFISNNIGWIPAVEGKILKTTNGGKKWECCFKDYNKNFYYLDFISSTTGWACGIACNKGFISKSTDGGFTWSIQLQEPDEFITSLFFVSGNTGWAVSQRYIYYTTDSGQNWAKLQNTFLNSSVWNKVFFINENIGWYIGQDKTVLKSIDGGKTWQTIQIPVNTNIPDCEFFFFDIYFISENIGWMVGSGDLILKTTDGGETWQEQLNSSRSMNELFAVHFISETNGWAAGSKGKILKTIDGGLNWNIEQSHTGNVLYDICVSSESTGWAVGSNGTILSIDNSSQTYVGQNSNKVIDRFELLNNYPNPFNPETSIKYQIPEFVNGNANSLHHVELKVFDALGREVSIIANQEQKPGNYIVNFNGGNLASGVYLYRIIITPLSNSNPVFTLTKKMVLIK